MRRTLEDTDKTVERILDSALTVFNQYGYHATKLDDIAKNAGMTRGPISWHFQNKSNLYKAVIEQAAEDLFSAGLNAFQEQLTPIERIETYINFVLVDSGKRHNRIGLLFRLLKNEDDQKELEEVKKTIIEAFDYIKTHLQEAIEEAINTQVIHTSLDPEFLTHTLHAYGWGLIVEPGVNYENYSNADYKNKVLQILHQMIGYEK